MPDRYQNFNELSQNENAYVVEQNLVPNSTWLIAAPHGGNIESGTTEIALAISHASSSSYYSFIGKKEPDGGDLQISSIRLFLSYERVITRTGGMADGQGNLSRSAFDITAVGCSDQPG